MKSISVFLIASLIACLLGTSNIGGGTYWGSFTPDKTYSYDRKYYALQTVEDRMIIVSVYSSDTNEKAADFSPARSFDFWGICWDKDSYDIWTQSADIGIYCYRYGDNKWTLDESLEVPSYIISKYDKTPHENIYLSPTE